MYERINVKKCLLELTVEMNDGACVWVHKEKCGRTWQIAGDSRSKAVILHSWKVWKCVIV